MPFRDLEWEDLQRDCDFFPAYTDYLYGPDRRLHVVQEPGLHPLLYPHLAQISAPVPYTNSMPSRSWSYRTADKIQSNNTPVEGESLSYEGMAGKVPNDDISGRSTPAFDMRSQMGGPMAELVAPQGVRTVTAEEMERRRMLTTSQQRPLHMPGTHPNPSQQPARMTRQQAQAMNTPTTFPPPIPQPLRHYRLRSSSATDVDEHVAQMPDFRQTSMPSPSVSPVLIAHQPASLPRQPPQNLPNFSKSVYQNTQSVPSAPVLVAPQKLSQKLPVLRPSDIANNPRYACLDSHNRQIVFTILTQRWNIVNSQASQDVRQKAFDEIQHASAKVFEIIRRREAAAKMRNLAQENHRQQPREAQMQQAYQLPQAPQMQQRYAQPQHLPDSSSTQALHQVVQQSPYQAAPQSTRQLGYMPPYTPQQQLPQQAPQQALPHPQPHQNPLQPSPFPPSKAKIQQHPHPPHQSPVQQSQHTYTSTSTPPSKPPEASKNLRDNIDKHLPQVWQCLKLIDDTYIPTSPDNIRQREQAQKWLTSFKHSLPEEGHEYMNLVVVRMVEASHAGKDPLSVLDL
ncbi:hypothetical protein BDW02DRAFT_595319 [Decorospora gaudefroyi]|uniref:Uncharacterized protein n=1 Tax=Decorospora gaudefroyi TaxID=184978 RepID=A0A6A5KPR4_9PLEO|nr:hypothetical protein BDW02DRAFT_595319 [Decorospora gaudefroyi]